MSTVLSSTKEAAAKGASTRRKKGNAAVVVPTLRISKHPLFCVVVIHADGSETVAQACLRPVAAVQYVSGYNSGHVAHGEWAEAREIDLDSVRFTGRLVERSDVRAESSVYKMNQNRRGPKAVANV